MASNGFPQGSEIIDFIFDGNVAFYVLQDEGVQRLFVQRLTRPGIEGESKYHFRLQWNDYKILLRESTGRISVTLETRTAYAYISDSAAGSISRFYYYGGDKSNYEPDWLKDTTTEGIQDLSISINRLYWTTNSNSGSSVYCGKVKKVPFGDAPFTYFF